MDNLAIVAEHRNMSFLKRGITAIDYKDRQGKVTGASSSGYVLLKFPDEKRGGHRYHPTWEMKYLDKQGNVLADYKTKPA